MSDISAELADLIYDKVGKNQVLRIDNIKQELCKPEKEEQIELCEEQEKNPYETLLIWDVKEGELKQGYMQMEKLSILSDRVKSPEERYDT